MDLKEAKSLYTEVSKDLEQELEKLTTELSQSGFIPYDIAQSFLSITRKWEGEKVSEDYVRRKVVRSITTVPLVEEVSRKKVPIELKKILVTLDGIVNSTDDLIDTKHMTTSDKVSCAVIIHFGNVLAQKILFELVKSPSYVRGSSFKKLADILTLGKFRRLRKASRVIPILYSYLLNISQIPSIEHQTYETILNPSSSEEEIINISVKNYLWRGRDIDAYLDIPGMWLDINQKEQKEIKELARVYRAIELVKKDLEDLKYDIQQETKTPLTALYSKYGPSPKMSKLIEEIKGRLFELYDKLAESVSNRNIVELLTHKLKSK